MPSPLAERKKFTVYFLNFTEEKNLVGNSFTFKTEIPSYPKFFLTNNIGKQQNFPGKKKNVMTSKKIKLFKPLLA